MHLFGSPVIVSMDPEVNKFILHNEGKLFQCHCSGNAVDMLGKWSLPNIHREMHGNIYEIVAKFFETDRLKGHVLADIDGNARFVLSGWRNRRVLVNEETKSYAIFLASKQLLGFPLGEETYAIVESCKRIFNGTLGFSIPLHGSRYSNSLEARNVITELVGRAIEDRKRKPEAEHRDILWQFLHQNQYSFSREQITDVIVHLLLAGYEKLGSNLAMVIKHLTDTPDALVQLRAEHTLIRKGKKPGELLTWEDYEKMDFSQNVVSESLRLTNVAAIICRKAIDDVEVKGLTFPKGWTILLATWPSHLSDAFFSNPLRFNPWRWQGKNFNSESYFLPFGAGPRYCGGSELARLEMIVFLHYLVTDYNWSTWFDEIAPYQSWACMGRDFFLHMNEREDAELEEHYFCH
eukprot:c22216_g1_i2 orf=594-1811(-)